MPKNITDEKILVSRAVAGCEESWSEIYSICKNRIYYLCLRLLKQSHLAEEMTQEVFLTIIEKIHLFDAGKGAGLSGWAAVIAHNKCIDYLRKANRIKTVRSIEEIEISSAPELLGPPKQLAVEQNILLAAALQKLSLTEKSFLLLRDVDGLSYEEIASRLNRPLGTVKSSIFRVRAKMRKNILRQSNPVLPPSSRRSTIKSIVSSKHKNRQKHHNI